MCHSILSKTYESVRQFLLAAEAREPHLPRSSWQRVILARDAFHARVLRDNTGTQIFLANADPCVIFPDVPVAFWERRGFSVQKEA